MRLPRRPLLLIAALWAGLPRWPVGAAARPREPLAALPGFVDTLLPGDDASPAATDLAVDQGLLAGAADSAEAMALLEAGCAWLDAEARAAGAPAFASLDAAGRASIAARAEAGAPGSGERRFFESVRQAAFARYYSDPRSWAPLDYAGPPQPRGFRDHAEPPA